MSNARAVMAAFTACIPEHPGPWASADRDRWLKACAAIFDFFYTDNAAPEPANMPEVMPPVAERRLKGKRVLWLTVRDALADGEAHNIRDVARGLVAAGNRRSVKQLASQIYGRCLIGHAEEFRSPARGKIQLRSHELVPAPATTGEIVARINDGRTNNGALWKVVRDMLTERGEPMSVAELARLTGKPAQQINGSCLQEHPETFCRPQPGMLALPQWQQITDAREQAVAALRGLGEKNGYAKERVDQVVASRPDLAGDAQGIVREAFRLAKETQPAPVAAPAVKSLAKVNRPCPHHWLIGEPNGPTARGTCKLCGLSRDDFENHMPEPKAGERRMPDGSIASRA